MTKTVTKWHTADDDAVRHVWKRTCTCPGKRIEKVNPSFYADAGGIPICEACGYDLVYVRTDIKVKV